MMKIIFNLTMFFFIFLLLSFNTSAFSLSPPSHPTDRRLYNYDEFNGLNEDFSFRVISNSNEPILIKVEVSDNFKEYITFPEEDFVLEPKESKTLSGNINLPPGLDNVGEASAEISFTKSSLEEGMLAFTTAYAGLIRILFKYPGEFIAINSLEIENVKQGKDTFVTWVVEARGESLTSYVNELKIIESGGEVVFSHETEKNFLSKNERRKEKLDIPSSSFSAGSYRAFLTSTSEDNFAKRDAELRIGEEDVALTSFEPKTFVVGDFLEFSFILQNLWNDDFNNAYAVFKVEDVSITTKSFDLKGFRKVLVEDQIINLRGLEEGEYKAELTVFFGEHSKTFDVDLVAVVSSEKAKKGVSFTSVLVSVLILLALAGILVLLFKKKK